jgi:hypothetical protein
VSCLLIAGLILNLFDTRSHRNKTRRHQQRDKPNAHHPIVHGNNSLSWSNLFDSIDSGHEISSTNRKIVQYLRARFPKRPTPRFSTADLKINLKKVNVFKLHTTWCRKSTIVTHPTTNSPQKHHTENSAFPMTPLKNTAKSPIRRHPLPGKKITKTVT